jgi:gliding motility-associated-like protein
MLDSLLKSPVFKAMYDQQWIDMLNGVFKCENILAHYDSVAALLQPEMQRQINRWGGSMADWQGNIAYARNQIAMRCAVISGKLDTCLNLYPQELILNVDPPNSGTIALDGSTKSPYIWRKIIEGDSIYTLQATPTPGSYWAFDYWEKKEAGNTFTPSSTSSTVQYDFNKKDSVVAHFKYFNYDSIDVTFDVTPPGTGVILLNGATLASYPVTMTLDRRFQYQIEAVPNLNHIFLNWNKNNGTTTITPTLTSKQAYLNFKETENIVANFEFVPPPPPPIPPPPVPVLSSVDQQVFIPNVFSPNGDGTNDVFSIRTGKDVVGVDISIFDRWGKLVFQTNDPTLGWDGTYSGGTTADVGTYQYYVKVRFRDKSVKSYQGDLTLLR